MKRLAGANVLIGLGDVLFGGGKCDRVAKKPHTTLVGEATGGKTSGYAEVTYVTLPKSKLKVQFTSKWFGSAKDPEPDAPRLVGAANARAMS